MINNDLQVVFIFLAKIMHGAINEDFSKFSLLTYLSSKCVMNWVCLKIGRLSDSLHIQSSTFWTYQIYIYQLLTFCIYLEKVSIQYACQDQISCKYRKILFIFYNDCKKSKKKPWQTMVWQKTPKGQKIAIPETIVHHEIPRNFLTREWLKA